MTSAVQTLRSTPQGDDAPDMLYQYLTPLRPLLTRSDLSEIAVNRPGEAWIEGTGGWARVALPELTFAACMQLARLIANFNKKAIDIDKPVLSGSLIYGERVQVVMPPACEGGTVSITIRKPSLVEKSLDELDAEGSFATVVESRHGSLAFEQQLQQSLAERRLRDFLGDAVRTHRNVLIVGKTGSGKTTATRSLINCIPAAERLITIEDAHELFIRGHPNRVHLFYSREDEGGSSVTARQVLTTCLRMKPDRILLAELRGDEAWEFIKSVNTGHPGSITTMHANGAFEAFEQLTALIKDSPTGAHLATDYIKRRLLATIDVVLFYDKRKLKEVFYDPELKRAQLA